MGSIVSGGAAQRLGRRLGVLLLPLALAGCVTPYGGGYGGYPGGGYPGGAYPDGYGADRMLATVQRVDTGYGRLLLTEDRGGYGGGSVEVYYDRGTRLFYRGQEYPVEGLERGDRISIDVARSGGRLWARRIEVVQNIRDGYGSPGYGTPPYGGGAYGEPGGAVSHVDPGRRVIEFTRGGYSGPREQVFYDDRTHVEYRGQRVRPEQLEAGDVIRVVQSRMVGGGRLAERIVVDVSARSRW